MSDTLPVSRIAKMDVAMEVLAQALNLPSTARIFNAAMSRDYPNTIELLVESPDLPEARNDHEIPTAVPSFITRHVEAGAGITVKQVEFVSWNIKPTY